VEQAREIEKHLKKMKSRKYLENLKRYPEMLGKLLLRFDGSCSL
jgi:putative endonuclease